MWRRVRVRAWMALVGRACALGLVLSLVGARTPPGPRSEAFDTPHTYVLVYWRRAADGGKADLDNEAADELADELEKRLDEALGRARTRRIISFSGKDNETRRLTCMEMASVANCDRVILVHGQKARRVTLSFKIDPLETTDPRDDEDATCDLTTDADDCDADYHGTFARWIIRHDRAYHANEGNSNGN